MQGCLSVLMAWSLSLSKHDPRARKGNVIISHGLVPEVILFLSLLFGRSKCRLPLEERRIRVCFLITKEFVDVPGEMVCLFSHSYLGYSRDRVSQSNWKPSWASNLCQERKKCAPCGGTHLYSQHLGGKDWQFLSWRLAWNIW